MTIIIIVITVLCITIAHNTSSQSSQGPGFEGDGGYSVVIGTKILSFLCMFDAMVMSNPELGRTLSPDHVRFTQRTIPPFPFLSPLMLQTCSPEEISIPLRPRWRSELLDLNTAHSTLLGSVLFKFLVLVEMQASALCLFWRGCDSIFRLFAYEWTNITFHSGFISCCPAVDSVACKDAKTLSSTDVTCSRPTRPTTDSVRTVHSRTFSGVGVCT